MFAEFLNQFGKETDGSSYNVLDRQIVLYTNDTSLGRKVEHQNPKGNGVNFDTFNNENIGHGRTDFEVPFEDVIGPRAKDGEVGREVGGEEPKKYLFEGTFDVDADDDYILVNDSTPDIPRKRIRKATAVFRSPYTSNFGSSAKSKVISSRDKDWKKRFDDKNEILNLSFYFGVLEVANNKWFYDLQTPGECLRDSV
ncbi:hypothetical protein Adt_05263 [Abeliophyllum distichum]|uniref:Uncharacterized protein n=1 Tax=Abeliophyllum distichum TaxID=126358 RepID=A0ABD1V3L8_9LAMI